METKVHLVEVYVEEVHLEEVHLEAHPLLASLLAPIAVSPVILPRLVLEGLEGEVLFEVGWLGGKGEELVEGGVEEEQWQGIETINAHKNIVVFNKSFIFIFLQAFKRQFILYFEFFCLQHPRRNDRHIMTQFDTENRGNSCKQLCIITYSKFPNLKVGKH